MENFRFYFSNPQFTLRLFNRWDLIILILVCGLLLFLGWTGKHMAIPYALGDTIPISLSPSELPFYASRTVLRMFIALIFSLLFTFTIGTLAAKNRQAEKIIIPSLDILQSVPILSFLAITVTGFIQLFPGSLLGPECASIFAIFTSQVWNITLSFYQSLKTVPSDLIEAGNIFQLSAWQKFWKIEVPFSLPGLLWNMMVSMSASWFFVVLSETIIVSHQNIQLPGIGSYIALAIDQHQILPVTYAITAMIIVIFLYDQVFFRPLIAWSEKFKMEIAPDDKEYQSWLINLLRSSSLLKLISPITSKAKNYFINIPMFRVQNNKSPSPIKYIDKIWTVLIGIMTLLLGYFIISPLLSSLAFHEITHVILLGAATGLRVIILIILSSLVWIPVGVLIGLNPNLTQKIQPIIQFLAAFPANLFYPIFVIIILRFHLSVEIWVTPLMILGTQWYILFNVIAGASYIPRELYMVADNLGVKGFLWWKRLALPGVYPYYITGAITAAGGAWNASIVAEWVSWGNTTLKATGLGEYIHANTISGDLQKMAFGTIVMCLYVLLFNRVFWRPLYRVAQERYKLS